MPGLVREWLAELKVMGRSEQTIKWYQQKMDWYLGHEGGPATLDGITSAEVKRLLGPLIDRGLAPNTVHGFFEVVRAFANWALGEGFAVDPAPRGGTRRHEYQNRGTLIEGGSVFGVPSQGL